MAQMAAMNEDEMSRDYTYHWRIRDRFGVMHENAIAVEGEVVRIFFDGHEIIALDKGAGGMNLLRKVDRSDFAAFAHVLTVKKIAEMSRLSQAEDRLNDGPLHGNAITLDQHFLRTLDDLRRAAESSDDYVLVRASGLLRQLILDGKSTLLHKVNRERREKSSFSVVDFASNRLATEITLDHPITYLHGDALHESGAMPNMQRRAVKLDEFLAMPVGIYNGEPFTIRMTIERCANVLGGVHIGTEAAASDPEVERMRQLRITIGGMRPLVLQLRSIIKVVLDAVAPLEQRVREHPRPD